MNTSYAFDDLAEWLTALSRPATLLELGVLLLCAGLAWVLVSAVRRSVQNTDGRSILFGRRVVDGVLFPLLLLCLAYGARVLLSHGGTTHVFRIALPALVALLVIRMGVKVLQVAFRETPLVRVLERSISWVAWGAMVLWVSGLLPLMRDEKGWLRFIGDPRSDYSDVLCAPEEAAAVAPPEAPASSPAATALRRRIGLTLVAPLVLFAGERVQAILPPPDNDEVVAVGGKAFGERLADPRGRAGDEGQ